VNGYICFYNGERYEVHADTPLKAQEQVQALVQAKYKRRRIRPWHISVALAERNGEQVTHVAVD